MITGAKELKLLQIVICGTYILKHSNERRNDDKTSEVGLKDQPVISCNVCIQVVGEDKLSMNDNEL